MSTYSIGPEKEEQLTLRMARLGVQESDIEESFVRSSGPGGQNVNKTATCVVLLHRPTGVQVKCQTTRQQGLNRYHARLLLLEKLEGRQQAREEALRARLAKARRQNRRPSRRAKERTLAGKARQSAKKSLRRRVGLD